MQKMLGAVGLLLLALLGGSSINRLPVYPDGDTPLSKLYQDLGEKPSPFLPDYSVAGVSAERGEAIVRYGIAGKPKGGQTSKQSKHFVCTSCHNLEREDPDLRFSDPEARLDYVVENDLPFLQGTTLYGAVNRSSFYNGDYQKKYGQLVEPARHNLREAVQLCAIECSQGRLLEDWELESVMAFLWTIELRLSDLQLKDSEQATLHRAVRGKTGPAQALTLLKSKYLAGSPATFIDPPANRQAEVVGNPANGALLYEKSCLHCHEDKRYSYFLLDQSTLSFNFLEKHFPTYSRYSVYQVARYGTTPVPGKKAYMPNYTLEKMNRQQLSDLRAFIEQQAQ